MMTIKDLPFETRVRIAREHQFYVLMHDIARAIYILVVMAIALIDLALFV